ncbi:TonB-dependent receptor [Pseudobacter ginsenosidimutans]|nr:TonB-dependent receptor [Pseudobacter ginsenosidimutans]
MLLVFLLTSIALQAQTSRIQGRVLSKTNSTPLEGVTVNVKGTNTTTLTDADGRFTVDARSGDLLAISFVGHRPVEVKITEAASYEVLLEENISQLDDIVVIGYGTQKKKLVTGANLQVKGTDIQKQNTTNALQALQGQAPGVQITSTSGQPGAGMNVIIRGKGTIGNFGPLYVVDGVNTGDISYLNPADIESIDVLKDAASAAIYGSQGANGVILITTKSGRNSPRPAVTYDGFFGIQNPERKAKLLNAKEYATIMNEAAVNSGKQPYFTQEQISNLPVNTNWMDEMFVKDAATQNHVVGVTGGNNASVYSMSIGYTAQEGMVGGKSLSNYERYSLRLNSEHSLYQKIIRIGQHLTFNYEKSIGIGVGNIYNNTLRNAFGVSPFVPMYDSVGKFWDNSNSTWNNGEANPYALMHYTNQRRNNNQRVFGDIYLVVEPIKGLRYRSALGLNYTAYEGRSYSPIYKLSVYNFNDFTRAAQNMSRGRTLQFDNQLNYSRNIKGGHFVEAMVGTSAIKTQNAGMYGQNRDLILADLRYAWLTNATNTDGANISLNGAPYEEALLSYYGRLQYNFNEKFLFNATIRADASSKFADGHRWGYFPSFSAGWIASNESFLQSSSWLNFLKLRASWGQVGNQAVDGNQYVTPIIFANTNYIFGNVEGINTPGAYPGRLSNPAIHWETGEQTNVGIDATVMKNLNINFDFYIKDTRDWLIRAPVLATAGAEAPVINGGTVRNTGVELGLNWRGKVGELSYTLNLNGAYNKNKIGKIPTQDGIVHGNTNTLYANSLEFYRAQDGYPVGVFWGLKTNGIFQSEAELAAHNKNGTMIQPNAQPGDVRYVDINNDGVINENDRSMIGDPNPDLTYGFGITAEYKGFDLIIQANGVAGNQLVQSWRNQSDAKANYSTAILDRWHGPGSSNRIPRVTEDNRNWTQFSDLYIHDGDFLRISNISVGYDFARIAKKSFLSKLRIYAAALNAITFTKYEGMDPEIGYGEGFSSGVDLGYYPRPRILMIGANFKF